jgi:hypothetical protein
MDVEGQRYIAKFCEDVSSASIDVVEPYALRSDQDCRAAVGTGRDGEVPDHRQAVGRILDRARHHRRRHELDRSDRRLGLASLFVVSATERSSVDGALTTPQGEPLNPNTDHTHWKRLLSDAGLRDGRLNDARHTAATMLQMGGVASDASFGGLCDRRMTRSWGFLPVASAG